MSLPVCSVRVDDCGFVPRVVVPRRIYVSGPIGANDAGRDLRLRAAIDAGVELLRAGFDPFVPHLWAAAHPDADALLSYEQWMAYDLRWIERCDALLRIPGESPGADREVEYARGLGISVFFGVAALLSLEAAPCP